MGIIYQAPTSLFLIDAEVPSMSVTDVFPKLRMSIINGCYRAHLVEEERDVRLADSFIRKCLFGVSLSAWLLLLLSPHFSLLAPHQLPFSSVSEQREID